MTKLRRGTQTAFSEGQSLRLRAAWLYYNHGLTQKDVADKLGVSRTTVVRLIEEARRRGEVQIWISEGEHDCVQLALALEQRFGLDEAIVVPAGGDAEQSAKAVGTALGKFLSEAISDGAVIGVGWGRTLSASLSAFRPPRREGVRVVSLIGGVSSPQIDNPIEYTWRLASLLDAECDLFFAPLLVDSAETRRRLIEKCGLDRLYRLAETLDIAVISAGDIGPGATSLSLKLMSDAERDALIAAGAVCDVLCNFIDAAGRSVDHPIAERVMSVDLDTLARARHIVLASGGAGRATAIRAAITRVGCNTLVTDEAAARALLASS